MRPHPRRARTNATSPEAWGTSDRGGWVGNQRDLRWQMQWAGTGLVNTRILVFEDEYDEPQRQLGTIILPPDPVSIPNARPEPYAIDEYWMFEFEGVDASILEMEGSQAAITLEYGIYDNDGNYPAAGPFPISGFPLPSSTAPVFNFSNVKQSQYLVIALGGFV